jgi:O-succinylbenzoate synthase
MLAINEILDSLHIVKLELKVPFRGVNFREVAIFKGPRGFAEFSPFLEYEADEAWRWLSCAIEAGFSDLPTLQSAIEVPINATLPALNDRDEISQVLALYPGAKTVKIKVTNNLGENLDRISLVKEINPEIKIRIDVNGSWKVDEAITQLREISDLAEIEYVEQPVATREELVELKRKISTPIAVDELLRKAKDPLTLDLVGVADFIILKVAPLGGIRKSLQIANRYELPVVVSSALESAVGISYGAQLAKALPDYRRDSGLATGALFQSDLVHHQIHQGKITISMDQPSNLLNFAVDESRRKWWENRIHVVFQKYLEMSQ